MNYEQMSPESQRRVRAQTDRLMGLDVHLDDRDDGLGVDHLFDLANEASKREIGGWYHPELDDGEIMVKLPSAGLNLGLEEFEEEEEEEEEEIEDERLRTPTPKPKPLPVNHSLLPPPPFALKHQGPSSIQADLSSSPDSMDTPIDEQNARRRVLERERLARLNAITPTRPHVPTSEARMLWTGTSTGFSKRSFKELDADAESDATDREEEVADPRRKLFTPRLSAELEAEQKEREEREGREGSVATQTCEEEGKVEVEMFETPSKSSEYKQSSEDDHGSGKLV